MWRPVGDLSAGEVSVTVTIRRQADFDLIFARGKRYRSSLLTAVVHRRQPGEGNRAAYVASRKVARKAVDRNRLRRRLREALRSLEPLQGEGTDVVLIAHGPAAGADYWRLREALIRVLTQAGLYRGESPRESSSATPEKD